MFSLEAGAQSFERRDFPAALAARSVTVADFNRDGIPDAATATFNGAVSVLLGMGPGNFGAATVYPSDGAPAARANFFLGGTQLAAGDFNRDGMADLAVLDLQGKLTLLPGNGDGTFRARTEVGPAISAIAVADFNRDGADDIAAISAGGSAIVIRLANGDGTFSAKELSAPDARVLAAADFNGDNIADLAWATCCDAAGFLVDNFAVALGNGDGTFRAQAPRLHTGPLALATGDIDGDGLSDVAMSYTGCHTPCKGVDTYLSGAATRVIGGALTEYLYTLAGPLTVGDLNGDGKADAALATTRSDGAATANPYVTLMLGAGNGTFPSSVDLPARPGAKGIAAADVNRDGRLDLVVANEDDASVSVLLSTSGGTAAAEFALSAAPQARTVARGQSANYAITVTPQGPFSGAVTLSCGGLPAGTSCAFSPGEVAPGGSATMTVATTGASTARLPLRLRLALWLPIAGLAVAGFGGKRKLTAVAVLLAVLVALAGCAGISRESGDNPSSSSTAAGGTPAGTFTISVIGASGGKQSSVPVTLLVQ